MKEADHDYVKGTESAPELDPYIASLNAMSQFSIVHGEGPGDHRTVLALAYLVDRYCGRELAEPLWQRAASMVRT